MKGLILAGGRGTRLRPLTYTGNKHLIPIANKPILYYAIQTLKDAGINDIGIILGNNDPDAVKKIFGDGSELGVKITYIMQGEPRGIAHAVYCAKKFVSNDDFIVYLGDNLLRTNMKNIIDLFNKETSEALITIIKVKNPKEFGVVEIDKTGKIIRLVEKSDKFVSDIALAGVYILKPGIFDIIEKIKPSARGELEITDAIDNLVQKKMPVSMYMLKEWWKDTGKPEDILHANKLVLDEMVAENKGKIEDGVRIHGRVSICEGTIIKKGTVIKGPVSIGKNCIIGPESYIGPYTSIGDNTTIENGEIEDSIVIGDCKIKSRQKIVDSLIGKNCEIMVTNALPKGSRMIIGENSRLFI